MPQRKAEAWPPFMLEILIAYRYITTRPAHWFYSDQKVRLKPSAAGFIERLERRGLIEPINYTPYHRLTDKGNAVAERILSASTAIANRIAPPKSITYTITGPVRITFPHLRDAPPDEWKHETNSKTRYVASAAIRFGDVVHFDSLRGTVRPSKLSDPHSNRYRAKEDIKKGESIRWNIRTRGVRKYVKPWVDPVSDDDTIFVDRQTDKVYRKHWCHGIPYWLPVTSNEPYETFMRRALRMAVASFGGTLRDNMRQSRTFDLYERERNMRPGLGRRMKVPGGVFGSYEGDNVYVIDHAWLDLYDRFKAIGTKLHEQGRLTRREWKIIFDAVFIRTKKLTNVRLAKEVLNHLRIEARTGGPKPFGQMYGWAVSVQVRA